MMKRLVTALSAATLLLSHATPAAANDYIYLASDSSTNRANIPLRDNEVYYGWWIGGGMTWSVDSAITTPVTTAVTNWNNAIPQLPWASALPADANLRFYVGNCPAYDLTLNIGGCFSPTDWLQDPGTNASYWEKANIWVNDFYVGDDRIDIAVHEIGHAYGLHERYIGGHGTQTLQPVACNDSEITVMDAQPNCDNLQGPAQLDIGRVRTYWSQGQAVQTLATDECQPDLTSCYGIWTWKDDAWSNNNYRVIFQYYQSPTLD